MPQQHTPPAPAPVQRTQQPAAPSGGSSSSIGPSLIILGELSGQEDLTINGRVEGKVELKQHSVTVGRKGQVKADIIGQAVRVEGQVQGNLYGATDITITKTGSVRGNIVAPRVVLENGSKFKGSIDMEPEVKKQAAAPAPPANPAAKPAAPAPAKPPVAGGAPKAPGASGDSKSEQMGLGSSSGAIKR